MGIENREKFKLADGREVWRHTYVRYRDASSGKFISKEELGEDPLLGGDKEVVRDPDRIEDQVLATLLEIATDQELAAKSTSSMKLLMEMVEKMKLKSAIDEDEEWFILGRQLAKEVLELLEEDPA